MSASLEALVERLLGRGHRGMVLGLESTRAALAAVGDPHVGLRAFHVAGSNGKGSTCAMIDAALADAGIRRGLYTSPHLERFNERIAIDGAPIADDAFASALSRVFERAAEGLTFFETLTVAAFVAFREASIDVAVLEVGLGGRLDSTNVIDAPLAAGVVSITRGANGAHLEHAAQLGSTAEAIAAEKAGIFKRGCPAVLGPMDAGPRAVCERIARDVGASPITLVDRHSPLEIALAPGLAGAHQRDNAAVAAAMLLAARDHLPELAPRHIEHGIANARWAGRLESIDVGGVHVLLDGAHNVDGARVLLDELERHRATLGPLTLVFGALADKGWAPFLDGLAPLTRDRFYAEPGGRAPAPLAELVARADGVACATVDDALRGAIAATPPGGTVLVTGSLYLVGTARAAILGARRDPAVGL